jgi:cysteine-rich repeat protein
MAAEFRARARWRTSTGMRCAVLGAWLCTSAGCDVFDEALEKRIASAHEPDDDAGVDAGRPPLMLADRCEASRPEVTGDPDHKLIIPTTGLHADTSESGEKCQVGADALSGAEGFFQIKAKAGERWHFHLDPAAGQNLAILALDGDCDVRGCFASADVCGTNESEHFTFIPTVTGTYIIMVEGINASLGADLTMLAVNPECGDNFKHHSEVCDDGNVQPGDGCDEVCRVELRAQNSEETEPNDDSFGANVLTPPRFDQPIIVRGKIAGTACQPDYFLLRVQEQQKLTATVSDAAGAACTDAPPIEIQLREAQGELREGTKLKTAPAPTDGTCPTFSTVVEAGTYFIRVQHKKVAEQFDYQLSLKLEPPT